MSNLKSITELPLAESAEGLNLIVNDGGAAKQIPAGAVGAQADWNEADENSPSFIKNKPTKLGGYNRELIYENHFAAEDQVYECLENFDDMSIFFEDGVEMSAEVELYAWNSSQGYALEDRFGALKLIQYERFFNTRVEFDSYYDCDALSLECWCGDSQYFYTDEGDYCYIEPNAEL